MKNMIKLGTTQLFIQATWEEAGTRIANITMIDTEKKPVFRQSGRCHFKGEVIETEFQKIDLGTHLDRGHFVNILCDNKQEVVKLLDTLQN